MQNVWDTKGTAEIYIPLLIDHYNHFMGGVDLADQRIAYYQQNLRCHRTWVPMFIQLLGIAQTILSLFTDNQS